MMPNLTKLYKSIWANLEKHSMKKNRMFKEINEELGYIYKHVPKFVDVRFRYIIKLAEYCEENNCPLYMMYTQLAERVKAGKEPSETETVILEIYLQHYILVRLINKFLVFAIKPLTAFIDFFNQEKFMYSIDLLKWCFYLTSNWECSQLSPQMINLMQKVFLSLILQEKTTD